MSHEFTDLLLRIGVRAADGAYPVEAQLEDGSIYFGGRFAVAEEELLALAADDDAYGALLFDRLLADPLRRAFDMASGRAQSASDGRLRLRLWIDPNAAELQALRWERLQVLLNGERMPVAATARTPFSRYVGLELAEPAPLRIRPLRALVVVSNPSHLGDDQAAVDVDAEVENVRAALADFRQSSQMDIAVLPGHTGLSSSLERQLRAEGHTILEGPATLSNVARHLPDCHILFFVGHGAYRRRGGDGHTALFLEDDEGQMAPVVDTELVEQLKGLDQVPHLVFLVACQSALRELTDRNPFVGLAPRLVAAGVPAVVAMQDEVSMESARLLAGEFFRRLLQHGCVDLALNQARLQLIGDQRPDWSIPVLFSRLSQGLLFAPDPVDVALRAIREQQNRAYPSGNMPLPIDVVHLAGAADLGGMEVVRQEAAATQDLVDAALNILSGRFRLDGGARRAPFVVLVGDSGSAKSTKLSQIALMSALPVEEAGRVVPLYVDLERLSGTQPGAVESLLFETLQALWPDLTRSEFADLLQGRRNVALRILVDGSDSLGEASRRAAWAQIAALTVQYEAHSYLLVTDPDHYDAQTLAPTDVLFIQPLAERKIKRYLEERVDAASRRLLRTLERHELFDLAAIPWLMGRLLGEAEQNAFPTSRTAVLQDFVEEAVRTLPAARGIRSRANATLDALAFFLQMQHQASLSVDDAFMLLAEVRGAREYTLEEMSSALIDAGLLTRVGDESLRFVYRPIQAFCAARAIAARPDSEAVTDDITASLGRLSRLRWWEDTLVFLCGLGRQPRTVLEQVVYGVNLLTSEQAFLAVRCICEVREHELPEELVVQVSDALIWRLDARHEANDNQRLRAIAALGQLGHQQGASYLLRLANRQVRANRAGDPEFEPSHVRLAAVQALQRLMPQVSSMLREADPLLYQLLDAWFSHIAPPLFQALRGEEASGIVLAAFLLADWQPADSFEALVDVFFKQEGESQISWALVEALALYDPARVMSQVALPLLDRPTFERAALPEEAWERRGRFFRVLAYLIGKIRSQEPFARAFLTECLYEQPNLLLKGKAIEALGWIYDVGSRPVFESVALGEFDALKLAGDLPENETAYLQSKALAALAQIGDRQTLVRLRKGRAAWNADLERAFYQASEEIYWRLNMSR